MSRVNDYFADPRRVMLGSIAAPFVPSLAMEIPTFLFVDFWSMFFLGLLSVLTIYLPLVLWRLPQTRHPLLTCVMLGGSARRDQSAMPWPSLAD